jgi:hypothetical protein
MAFLMRTARSIDCQNAISSDFFLLNGFLSVESLQHLGPGPREKKTLIPGFEWQPGFAGLAPAQSCTPQAGPKIAQKKVLAEMAALPPQIPAEYVFDKAICF